MRRPILRPHHLAILTAYLSLAGIGSSATAEDPCSSPIPLIADASGQGVIALQWQLVPDAIEIEIHSPSAGGYLDTLAGDASFYLDTSVADCQPRDYFLRVFQAACAPRESSVVWAAAIPEGGVYTVADFTGDRQTDFAVYRPSDATWRWRAQDGSEMIRTWLLTDDTPVTGDFDGDGKTDVAIFRPTTGNWRIENSCGSLQTVVQWGLGTDIPVPMDYDGDGRTDIAIFRPDSGDWWVQRSKDGSTLTLPSWGQAGDLQVPADYDGDGQADFAVYRPADSSWWIYHATEEIGIAVLGGEGEEPVPADYDGDGRADLATYRGEDGTWKMYLTASEEIEIRYVLDDVDRRIKGGRPVPGHYDHDRIADIAVVVNGQLWVMKSSKGGGLAEVETFGAVDDVPASWLALPRPPPL